MAYYLNQNGIMVTNTTTLDGYLVAADGSWVTETQATGGYVRTPYDNLPCRFDPDWQRYIFDEDTDYAEVSDNRVLAAIGGVIQVSELSDTDKVVYDELCKFLIGFDYEASDCEKDVQPVGIQFVPDTEKGDSGCNCFFASDEKTKAA
ncbi:MAG: hypothetical protein LIP16_00970 [Clostridium sp.]|nr:hypothetical protein [Clostridium sp.]